MGVTPRVPHFDIDTFRKLQLWHSVCLLMKMGLLYLSQYHWWISFRRQYRQLVEKHINFRWRQHVYQILYALYHCQNWGPQQRQPQAPPAAAENLQVGKCPGWGILCKNNSFKLFLINSFMRTSYSRHTSLNKSFLAPPSPSLHTPYTIACRAGYMPSRRFKSYNYREGCYWGLLVVENIYKRFHI